MSPRKLAQQSPLPDFGAAIQGNSLSVHSKVSSSHSFTVTLVILRCIHIY